MVEFLVSEGEPVEYKQPVVVISPYFGEQPAAAGCSWVEWCAICRWVVGCGLWRAGSCRWVRL